YRCGMTMQIGPILSPVARRTVAPGSKHQSFGQRVPAGWTKERSNADEQRWAAMNSDGPERDVISERIIGAAFTVANALDSGFPEQVCEKSPALELRVVRKRLCLLIKFGRPRVEVQRVAGDSCRAHVTANRAAPSLFITAHRCSSAL